MEEEERSGMQKWRVGKMWRSERKEKEGGMKGKEWKEGGNDGRREGNGIGRRRGLGKGLESRIGRRKSRQVVKE